MIGLLEKEKINTTKNIEEILQDDEYIRSFTCNDAESREHIANHQFDLNQIAQYVSNGIHNILVDKEEKYLHVVDGVRHTTGTPKFANNTIHMFGPCVVYGLCVSDSQTISSHLQRLLNDNSSQGFMVINHGLSYGKDLLNDILYMMATPVSSCDTIIWFSGFMNNEISLLNSAGIKVHSLRKEISHLHNWFLDNPFHCNSAANEIYARKMLQIISPSVTNQSVCTKQSMIEVQNIPLVYDPDALLMSEELCDYIKFLKHHRIDDPTKSKGCVVINANPCTRGHMHLINEALKVVDFLYVFLVQESTLGYSYLDREAMLKQNLKDINNVILLPGGNIFTSVVGFPEYFNRTSSRNVNPLKNHKIFCEKIAPALDITVRFFGHETNDHVTHLLNMTAQKYFPKYGIDVVIIPRLEHENKPISAKDVRLFIKNEEYDNILPLVTPSTFDYLLYIHHYGTTK